MKEVQTRRQTMTDELEQEARKDGFTLTFNQLGITPVPMIDGRAMTKEEFDQVPEDQRDQLNEVAERVQHSVTHAMQEFRRLNKEAAEQVKAVDADLVRLTLKPIVDELQAKYAGSPEVARHLDRVETDIVENLDIFKPREEGPPQAREMPVESKDEAVLARYRVNDLVDNTTCEGAPIIFEFSPTYYNLFGRIDYRARIGTMTTDLTMIKPGAIHRANGGYLVLQARDLLLSPLSWDTLKRTMRSGHASIENMGEQLSPLPSATLRPEPIPVQAKVVLVGSPQLLRMLQAGDEDFQRYFKVTADFDTVMDRSEENMSRYAAFIAARCRDANLRPFHSCAVASIIDHSSRLVEDREKLTTRFMHVSDIITEADYWAGRDGSDVTMDRHVKKAVDERRYRASLTEERVREFIERGTIHIATEGEAVGQVNGLAVLAVGDHSFGSPSRITARVSLGRGQVVNVERETKMSGKIHDKGFMILTGYVQGKYGGDKPLSLSASIGFEQTYSEVDGDSASSTELYALLSALSGLPIRQAIAVTGSVNQAGEVQAIGGATFKVEGFFDVCASKGLTGDQGVMIPRDNLRNLVLREDVLQAVRDGRFNLYAVSTIDEGIEVLTGARAGKGRKDGNYPKGTVHNLVEARLEEMAQRTRQFAASSNRQNSRPKPARQRASRS